MDLIEELKWRGMVQDMMPGTEEFLRSNRAKVYVGFDPTALSLGIGNMVPIMLLVHFQRHGHIPVALVGGATGMVGDPSGKSAERNLLSKEQLAKNQERIREQLSTFLDFELEENSAELYNNYDWFKNMSFLDFLRDVGKHLTINYMTAKDSVKSRMETGLSFTEFSYQLLQGYDFHHLHTHHGVTMQLGGSDQWGNITTGTELIRRMGGGDVYALVCPLITKADGGKFGKSEKGNVFLDAEMTSPYNFYQFWRDSADKDIVNLAKIFSLKPIDELKELVAAHDSNPNQLKHALAEEMTIRVHGQESLDRAKEASAFLFDKQKDLGGIDKFTDRELSEIFEALDGCTITRAQLDEGINVLDLSVEAGLYPSKGRVRDAMKQKAFRVNKKPVEGFDQQVSADDVIRDRYILLSNGRKKHHAVIISS